MLRGPQEIPSAIAQRNGLLHRLRRVVGRPSLQRIATNLGWLTLDRTLQLINGITVGAWTARYLGPADFGMLSYCFAFVALFSPMLKLGIDKFVIHDLVSEGEKRETLLGTSALLFFLGALAASGLAISLIGVLRPADQTVQQMVVVRSLIGFLQVSLAIDLLFQSQVASKWTVLATSLGTLLNAGLRILLISWQAPVLAFVFVGLCEAMLTAFVLWWIYTVRCGSIARWTIDIPYIQGVLAKSWPFVISGAAVAAYMKVDQLMLGSIRGDGELGLYSVAVRWVELTYLIPVMLASSLFPALVRLKQAGAMGLYRHRLQQYFDFSALAAFACVTAILLTARLIIPVLYGDAYRGSIPLLMLLIWATIPNFLGVARTQYLVNHDLAWYHMICSCIGLAANLCLNGLLIPSHGGAGAAVATLVSSATAAIVTTLLLPRLFFLAKMQFNAVFVLFRMRSLLFG